jgi:hypothetical protein
LCGVDGQDCGSERTGHLNIEAANSLINPSKYKKVKKSKAIPVTGLGGP